MPKRKPKKTKAKREVALNDLEEALSVKKRAVEGMDKCDQAALPKFIDAYARAANVVRQFEKDRKKSLASFSDDELVSYLRTLNERRREAILTAVQGAELADKPLFGAT